MNFGGKIQIFLISILTSIPNIWISRQNSKLFLKGNFGNFWAPKFKYFWFLILLQFQIFEFRVKIKSFLKVYFGIFWRENSNIAHYSQSHFFVQKFHFDKTQTFSQVFQPKVFRQFFSWNQSCKQLKSPKPQDFHEFFTQNNSTIFLGKSKLNFWTKKWRFRTVCSCN